TDETTTESTNIGDVIDPDQPAGVAPVGPPPSDSPPIGPPPTSDPPAATEELPATRDETTADSPLPGPIGPIPPLPGETPAPEAGETAAAQPAPGGEAEAAAAQPVAPPPGAGGETIEPLSEAATEGDSAMVTPTPSGGPSDNVPPLDV